MCGGYKPSDLVGDWLDRPAIHNSEGDKLPPIVEPVTPPAVAPTLTPAQIGTNRKKPRSILGMAGAKQVGDDTLTTASPTLKATLGA